VFALRRSHYIHRRGNQQQFYRLCAGVWPHQ